MATRRLCISALKLFTIFASCAILAGAASAPTVAVLYSFTDGNDGGYPSTDLVMDAAGNLYGSSVEGGTFGSGTVFKLTPSGTGYTQSVLYSFTGAKDGGQPYGGVTLDAQGNVYGTAVVGGSGGVCIESGCGVVYKLTNSGGAYTQSIIYNFQGGNDGFGPGSALSFDKNGNLYGMTPTGGSFGLGVIFQVHPNGKGAWRERVIHTFTGGDDGATASAGRLLIDSAGNIFGVATVGGANGAGVAFELSPAAAGTWNFSTLYSFNGQPDAGFPYGGLVADAAGNLYGTTYYAGANGLGSVYKLFPTPNGWQETVLHSFSGGSDGSGPISTLVPDRAGNLYGTTSEGGSIGCGCGTIFKMSFHNGAWGESIAHRFIGPPDGAFAYNGLFVDAAGNFYGTTVHGGNFNEGSVYKLVP